MQSRLELRMEGGWRAPCSCSCSRATDKQVLARVYDREAVVPGGFLVDPAAAPGKRLYWHRNAWVTYDADEARRWVEEQTGRTVRTTKLVATIEGPR